MRRFLLLFFPLFLLAQAPQAYNDLGEEIQKEVPLFQALAKEPRFYAYEEKFERYFTDIDKTFALGYRLDNEINSTGRDEAYLKNAYLKALRTLQVKREALKKSYYEEVRSSIRQNDTDYLLFLLDNAQGFLNENSRLKSKVISYANRDARLKDYSIIQAYNEEKELDERSYAYAQKMQEEYKAYQEVLRKQEAMKLRQLLVSKKSGGVVVYAQEENGDIDFVIENLFEMHVSATLYINDIHGYTSKETLPYQLVLKPKEKRKVIKLENTSKNKKVGYFNSHISWAKGAINAQADSDYVYILPFHERFKVSQGFNGSTSHKGTSQYAIDFAMPIGTPVYAARGGKVVEVVQRFNRHGLNPEMRAYANYVIIEHEDKTLGRYFHLKQDSVKPKVGDMIAQGSFLALSGDTGRTSGAHLHFVVTQAMQIGNEYHSQSIPIKFSCTEGVINNPIEGKFYCAKQ